MKRGITVDILDGYDNLLWKVLKPIDITVFDWQVMGREEAYIIIGNELGSELFSEDNEIMEGSELKLIKDNIYYLLFLDLKACPKGEVLGEIATFEEFKESKCEVVVLVADGEYIQIYAKTKKRLK